jgi:hypothetical protein
MFHIAVKRMSGTKRRNNRKKNQRQALVRADIK